MARTGADMREAQPFEQFADVAFVKVDAETLFDDAFEIDAPPTHDAVCNAIGASFDQAGQRLQLVL